MEQARRTISTPRGPAEAPGALGIDEAPEQRPGIPMEETPRPAEGSHWVTPPRQYPRKPHLRHKGLKELTPVFGTAQPPRGISGLLRRFAYTLPEHQARHWLLLRAADRVDMLEGRLGRALGRPLRQRGLDGVGRRVEENPARALVVSAAAAAGAVVLLRRAFD